MKRLDIDALDAVSGGVSVHALGVPVSGAGDAHVPYLNGAASPTTGAGLGNLGNLLGGLGGGAGGLGSLGGALGNIGPIVNELIHSPAVGQIVHTIEQAVPQLAPVINGVEHMLDGQGGPLNLGSLLGGLGNLGGGQNGANGAGGLGF